MELFTHVRCRSPRVQSPVQSQGHAGAFPRGPMQRRAHAVIVAPWLRHRCCPRSRCSGCEAELPALGRAVGAPGVLLNGFLGIMERLKCYQKSDRDTFYS